MNWSTKRTVTKALKIIKSLGYADEDVRKSGYELPNESTYIRIRSLGVDIRVSNHSQPPGGGYSIEKGERYGESEYSISPAERSVDGLAAFICQQKAEFDDFCVRIDNEKAEKLRRTDSAASI